MEVIKIEAGEYQVIKDGIEYRVSKDSYGGGWTIYDGPTYKDYICYKNTKKECLEYIENGYTVKILDKASRVPSVKIDYTQFRVKSNKNKDVLWTVDDVIYSTREGNWKIQGRYFDNSNNKIVCIWEEAKFESECEVIE